MRFKNIGVLLLIVLLFISLGFLLVNNSSSLEKKLCKELSQDGVNCTEIIFINTFNNLVFFKDEINLRYAIVNSDLSLVKVETGILDFNGFSANNSLIWQASNTLLWGFATEEVQSILITGDHDIQPNKIRYQGVWLWYHIYEGEVKLPVLLNAYNKEGTLIYGKE